MLVSREMMSTRANTRDVYGQVLLELAREGYDIVALGADTTRSMGLDQLEAEFAHRVYDVGIAEQNMVMVAAGLAAEGKMPFVSSYSVFASMRSLEQLRTFVAYPNLNVKVVTCFGGFTGGIDGVTHLAMEDLGIVRCIPNVAVLNPADAQSARIAIRAAAAHQGPVYVRLGRDPDPMLFSDEYQMTLGKANLLQDEGRDVAIFATGLALYQAIQAFDRMCANGIRGRLYEMHTLKPIDRQAILEAATATGAIVTVEEHNVIGGLGSAVAEVVVAEYPVPMESVAVPDVYTESALPDELRRKYGLTPEAVYQAAVRAMDRKRQTTQERHQ